MTLIPPGLSEALWRIVPAPLRGKLRTTLVKRFIRFAPAAVCAVGATQVTYIMCLGVLRLTAGISGFLGWLAGAAVSYVISRWAWERKGRPHIVKETLPFIVVSIGAGVILTLASKLGNQAALSMGLHDPARLIVADSFYFGANCLTFALRFLIFHYVLFADRKPDEVLAAVEGREPLIAKPVPGRDGPGHDGVAPLNGSAHDGVAPLNGPTGVPGGPAGYPGSAAPARRTGADRPALPFPERR